MRSRILSALLLVSLGACAVQAAESPTGRTATEPAHLVSMPALIKHEYDGRALRVGQVLDRTDAYTRTRITYRSGSLRISGVMNVPHGEGPFPVLVLAHGYLDPAVYQNGDGFAREQDYLASHGYVVLHTDYRNHAGSDDDPRTDPGIDPGVRLGYPEDLVNAARAIKRSGLSFVDASRVGVLGRSMGGGVALHALAAYPGLVDAAAIYSAVSSDAVDNYRRWIRGSDIEPRIVARFGSPQDNPQFWREASSRPYLDRVTAPILIQHGTSDDICPAAWSTATYHELNRLGKDVTLILHEGEEHRFTDAWENSIESTVEFFDRHLHVRKR